MKKAVIFDLDGTLLDTVVSIATAANKALEKEGFRALPIENYKYYAGDGADTLIKRALSAAGDESASHFRTAFETYKQFFEVDCTYQVVPFEGIVPLLDELQQKGIKTAVVSNKLHERTINVIDQVLGLEKFQQVLGQKDGLPKKPDPKGVLMVAEELGVKPEECVYVGDTDVDMKTGNAAGMLTVGVTWGFRDREELKKNNAHIIIDRASEILTIVTSD